MMFLIILKDVISASLGVASISVTGIYLIKRGIIDETKVKQVLKLVEQLFTPCTNNIKYNIKILRFNFH